MKKWTQTLLLAAYFMYDPHNKTRMNLLCTLLKECKYHNNLKMFLDVEQDFTKYIHVVKCQWNGVYKIIFLFWYSLGLLYMFCHSLNGKTRTSSAFLSWYLEVSLVGWTAWVWKTKSYICRFLSITDTFSIFSITNVHCLTDFGKNVF